MNIFNKCGCLYYICIDNESIYSYYKVFYIINTQLPVVARLTIQFGGNNYYAPICALNNTLYASASQIERIRLFFSLTEQFVASFAGNLLSVYFIWLFAFIGGLAWYYCTSI